VDVGDALGGGSGVVGMGSMFNQVSSIIRQIRSKFQEKLPAFLRIEIARTETISS
jgi:hypothetical protein